MFDFVFKVDATSNDFPAWDDFFDEENQSTVGDSPQISSPIFNEPILVKASSLAHRKKELHFSQNSKAKCEDRN